MRDPTSKGRLAKKTVYLWQKCQRTVELRRVQENKGGGIYTVGVAEYFANLTLKLKELLFFFFFSESKEKYSICGRDCGKQMAMSKYNHPRMMHGVGKVFENVWMWDKTCV